VCYWCLDLFIEISSILLPHCAQAALDHLSRRSDIDTSRIVVFGRSLGGAVGAVLTRNNPEKVPPVYYVYWFSCFAWRKINYSFLNLSCLPGL